MRIDDKIKMKVVCYIDEMAPKFTGTIYSSELRGIRTRYIYKDISLEELKRDVPKLKEYKKLSKIIRNK